MLTGDVIAASPVTLCQSLIKDTAKSVGFSRLHDNPTILARLPEKEKHRPLAPFGEPGSLHIWSLASSHLEELASTLSRHPPHSSLQVVEQSPRWRIGHSTREQERKEVQSGKQSNQNRAGRSWVRHYGQGRNSRIGLKQHSTSRSWTKRGLQSRLQVAAGRRINPSLEGSHCHHLTLRRPSSKGQPSSDPQTAIRLPSHLRDPAALSSKQVSVPQAPTDQATLHLPLCSFFFHPPPHNYPTLALSASGVSESTTTFGNRKLPRYLPILTLGRQDQRGVTEALARLFRLSQYCEYDSFCFLQAIPIPCLLFFCFTPWRDQPRKWKYPQTLHLP